LNHKLHGTEEKRFRVDLFASYFAPPRKYVNAINDKPSKPVPVASKTKALDLNRR